jgi:hypothetical protein
MLREPFKIKSTNSMAMEKLGLEDKKFLRGPLSSNLSFYIHDP